MIIQSTKDYLSYVTTLVPKSDSVYLGFQPHYTMIIILPLIGQVTMLDNTD